MIKSSDILENKKLPQFIRNHPIFKEYKDFPKIFPFIGLDNSESYVKDVRSLNETANEWRGLVNYITNDDRILRDLEENLIDYLDRLKRPSFIKNNKISLEALSIPLEKLIDFDIASKKPFSIKNNWKIVFSSTAWDIATISMRGIKSCQGWSKNYAKQLVGSIVDPYCGVIYLTDGVKTKLGGRKMLRRAIVRYVLKNGTEPTIFVEPIYPTSENAQNIVETATIFKAFLKKKLPRNISIVMVSPEFCLDEDFRDKYLNLEIPNSSRVTSLRQEDYTYTDTDLPYTVSKETHIKSFPSV